jgi:hypothetical protein
VDDTHDFGACEGTLSRASGAVSGGRAAVTKQSEIPKQGMVVKYKHYPGMMLPTIGLSKTVLITQDVMSKRLHKKRVRVTFNIRCI